MKEQIFIKNNTDIWNNLEQYYSKVKRKGFKSLSSNETKEYLHLFRCTSHNLAYAKTHYGNSNTVLYLNSLIGKCHSHIYGVKKSSLSELKNFICYTFPNLARELKYYILLSFGIFMLGALLSFIMTYINPSTASLFVPQSYIDGMKSGTAGHGGMESYLSPIMSSQIMTNNIKVSFLAFVFGITAGIGTLYTLFFNGTLMGGLSALVYVYKNDPLNYWSLILPHGVFELTAIFISGAAGLLIAKNMLIPGELSRWQSIVRAAKKSISLILGVIVMLIIAGLIEGFFTPMGINPVIKLIFSGVTALILIGYFSLPYLRKKS